MSFIPKVSKEDVEWIIQRDYPPESHELVRAELDKCNSSGPEGQRVQLAVLRLANANRKRLLEIVVLAIIDYRDVVALAENPRSMKLDWTETRQMSDTQREQLYQDDWRDYKKWFSGGSNRQLESRSN